ncbi:MAG: L-rhamnose isomerase [Spirochaetales bacterium]|nr:L-rhamnose isomerase [Spirochaetales bacterium]
MNPANINRAFEIARDRYAELGVDVAQALEHLGAVSLSIHCWQGDDVGGFETPEARLSGGGIQVTGGFPGKARTLAELRQDIEKVMSLLPGRHRLNLHAIYGDFAGRRIDRDQIEPGHFESWVQWAEANGVKLDFNCTCFSHPKAEAGFTLSSKDEAVRCFWIEHVKRCRRISAYMGEKQGEPCIHNLWIPDGAKDLTVDRFGYRRLLRRSLDEVYREQLPASAMKDAVESKLFGIGSESFVVGSHEFYMGYALSRGKLLCFDLGHFHPTESVADKISSIFCFVEELLLHVSRPVRWDSDHVVVMNDEVRSLFEEVVRSGHLADTHVGLDFFDGSINRVGAWVVGSRAALKSLLFALLEPRQRLVSFEERGELFARLALLEELKALPFGAVWDAYCAENDAPLDREIIEAVQAYQKSVVAGRS